MHENMHENAISSSAHPPFSLALERWIEHDDNAAEDDLRASGCSSLGSHFAHGLLHLLECPYLDLTDAFPGYAELL